MVEVLLVEEGGYLTHLLALRQDRPEFYGRVGGLYSSGLILLSPRFGKSHQSNQKFVCIILLFKMSLVDHTKGQICNARLRIGVYLKLRCQIGWDKFTRLMQNGIDKGHLLAGRVMYLYGVD